MNLLGLPARTVCTRVTRIAPCRGIEERDQVARALDHEAVELFAVAQRVVGGAAVGDVDEEALQEDRAVLLVAHGDRLVEHPDGAAVGGDQAVLAAEVLAGRCACVSTSASTRS